MAHTRFEDLKQKGLDLVTELERAEFERLLVEQAALLARPSASLTREDRRSLGFALRVVEHLRTDPYGTVSLARSSPGNFTAPRRTSCRGSPCGPPCSIF